MKDLERMFETSESIQQTSRPAGSRNYSEANVRMLSIQRLPYMDETKTLFLEPFTDKFKKEPLPTFLTHGPIARVSELVGYKTFVINSVWTVLFELREFHGWLASSENVTQCTSQVPHFYESLSQFLRLYCERLRVWNSLELSSHGFSGWPQTPTKWLMWWYGCLDCSNDFASVPKR